MDLASLGWPKIALIVALLVPIYGKVLYDLEQDWLTLPNLSQGFLIPPLALYIAWVRRHITLRQPAAPDNRGLLLSAGALLLFLLGKVGAEFFLQRISFVILLAGFTWTFWGKARLKTLALPLLLLATMVPLPKVVYERLSTPLQLAASDLGAKIARLAGVTVFRDGNLINLANITLGVEEACSGLNSLSAIVVGALLLGYIQCRRIITRVVLFALAVPLCIAVNIFRVAGTAILADYDPRFAMGFYHSFSGWLVFVGGFGLLYLAGRILSGLMDGPPEGALSGSL
jgi:exosortase